MSDDARLIYPNGSLVEWDSLLRLMGAYDRWFDCPTLRGRVLGLEWVQGLEGWYYTVEVESGWRYGSGDPYRLDKIDVGRIRLVCLAGAPMVDRDFPKRLRAWSVEVAERVAAAGQAPLHDQVEGGQEEGG